ncbi:uncharacterized protein [Anabrus simplex]|uniref:uncharacterized protein n=1 Tax=Anabrus simplex TaxID=316456 RepID=UPI0035A375CC
MESPPTCSTWSEAFPSSDDSGLLLTSGHSGSISSGSGGSGACHLALELQESDAEEKSLSQDESLDLSDGMCGENFNTLKKGPGWPELPVGSCDSKHVVPIEPPPEFQDSPPTPQEFKTKLFGLSHRTKVDVISCEKELDAVVMPWIEKFASKLVAVLLEEALLISCKVTWSIQCSQECHPTGLVQPSQQQRGRWSGPRLCWTPELLPFSPCNRPGSRSSLASSRLSSSHNSLSVPAANKADDSSFITSAMSHDVLTTSEISDMYNVPFDSDIYAVPIDVVRPSHEPKAPQRPKRLPRHHRKRRRHASSSSQYELERQVQQVRQSNLKAKTCVTSSQIHVLKTQTVLPESANESGSKRHSVPGTSCGRQARSASTECPAIGEPIHMTLHEVRQYLQNLYSSSSDSSENKSKTDTATPKHNSKSASIEAPTKSANGTVICNNNARKHKKNTFVINIKNKKTKESCELANKDSVKSDSVSEKEKVKKSPGRHSFSTNLKQTLCNIFRIRKLPSPDHSAVQQVKTVESPSIVLTNSVTVLPDGGGNTKPPFLTRALPPLPAVSPCSGLDHIDEPPDLTPLPSPDDTPFAAEEEELEFPSEELSMDFASSIEKVKDYGWYWGPISGEAAEKVLSNEPDGSFIVRDSSDDHYIFSLTFKLNGCIRHVRIEHDQGNFSFGSCTKFKSHTIVDFIENAVEHSRSGRYLFFLHRRPVLGPMRVQLLHPVSRFKQVQSLQHMCRFVILKLVRRDLINILPLPRRVIDYLSTPHYYSEQLLEEDKGSSLGPSPSVDDIDLFSFVPQGI